MRFIEAIENRFKAATVGLGEPMVVYKPVDNNESGNGIVIKRDIIKGEVVVVDFRSNQPRILKGGKVRHLQNHT